MPTLFIFLSTFLVLTLSHRLDNSQGEIFQKISLGPNVHLQFLADLLDNVGRGFSDLPVELVEPNLNRRPIGDWPLGFRDLTEFLPARWRGIGRANLNRRSPLLWLWRGTEDGRSAPMKFSKRFRLVSCLIYVKGSKRERLREI